MQKDPEELIIALDIGTTALKTGLFSTKGNLLQLEEREQKLLFYENERVEQSPYDTWQLIKNSIHSIVKQHDPRQIKAITVTVQRGTVVPIAADGKPLSDLVVWMDKRGIPYANMVNEKIGERRYYQTTGHAISYITGSSKVFWFPYHGKDTWEKTAVIGTPQTLFLSWLGCDDMVCDHSSGTYHFPMNIDTKLWSEEIASELNFPPEKLPKLVTALDVVGQLSPQAADELGLEAGIALVAGGGDGQCAAAGCGVIQPGLCMINIGTATGVQAFLSSAIRNPGGLFTCAGHVVPDGWETEGHTQASGAVLRWFREQFGDAESARAAAQGLDVYDLLINEAVKTAPGAEGLLFIPTFNGCTEPVIDPNARGVLLGLSLSHTRQHVIRAMLEGISLEIKWMLESLIASGVPVNELRLVGGGSKNLHWNQIHADILQRPVRTIQNPDAALVGAAMCAAVGLGAYGNLLEATDSFVQIKDDIEPRQAYASLYNGAYENYRKVFNTLRESAIFENIGKERDR